MRIGYFDCFSGAAGDMILAALVSAGLDEAALRAELAGLNLAGYELEIAAVKKQGFAATHVRVRLTDQPGHRHLHHITKIIDDSALLGAIKDRAKRVFTRLAEAEAKVHGTSIEKVHFHEVGAVDAIVDVVGAAIGVERLGLTRIICSPIPTGSGVVQCEHGTMPIPAPATAELLRGVPLAACDEPGELITPTGAAILTTLADSYGPLPAMRIAQIGYGAGTRDGKTRPNILRLLVGESEGSSDECDEVVLLETNLDDATGEQIAHAFEVLFAAGALDVFTIPIFMKKGRPGVLLSVLAPLERAPACEEALFLHTTTFGIRRQTCSRTKLARQVETVTTRFGPIRVKIGRRGGRILIVAPEYEDCAAAARSHHAALREVMFEAETAWRRQA
ncbi:MAG TPA: nickel pincer cofactor biosynthesis protein LarC [Phycisphaerae bacterium]|nr:nickel pincer cofactor biosynthesis protein LarC [Phycisphaerae bacterium]